MLTLVCSLVSALLLVTPAAAVGGRGFGDEIEWQGLEDGLALAKKENKKAVRATRGPSRCLPPAPSFCGCLCLAYGGPPSCRPSCCCGSGGGGGSPGWCGVSIR
jgi:hypothetical protein